MDPEQLETLFASVLSSDLTGTVRSDGSDWGTLGQLLERPEVASPASGSVDLKECRFAAVQKPSSTKLLSGRNEWLPPGGD